MRFVARSCGTAVVGAALAITSCSGSAPRPAEERASGALPPPPTRLPDGIALPAHTEVVGTNFAAPIADHRTGGWWAILRVDGDPVEAWDSLRRNASRGGVGLADEELVCRPAPDDDEILQCAHEVVISDGSQGSTMLNATLRWGGEMRYLAVQADRTDRLSGSNSNLAGYEDPDLPDLSGIPEPSDDSELSRSGEPFGTDHGCFVDDGYGSFRVPTGSQVLSHPMKYAFTSPWYATVLAVPDAEEALTELATQITGDERAASELVVQRPTEDGSQVWTLTSTDLDDVDQHCQVVASGDERFLLVMVWPYAD